MFSAKNISVQIGAKKLLEKVSLDIKPGEVSALLGANGAGKSTLLKSLCSDVKLTSGEVVLENRGLKEWHHYELARKRAVLSQKTTLSFPFTALEVVLLGRNPHVQHGRESARDLQIVFEALELVEAAEFAGQSFPTLSGGEQQRIHLARILAQIWDALEDSPRYLLLDEPTSSLDLAHQHLTLKIARKFARENTGVLVVLHDLNLAASYADKIYLLKNGRMCKSGTPAETLTVPYIKDIFGFDVSILEHAGLPLIAANTANYL